MKIERIGPSQWRVLAATGTLLGYSPPPAAVRAYLRDERNVFLLARAKSRAVGFARGTALRCLRSGRPQLFLYEMEVAAPYRRRGVGTALIAALLEHCRSHGFAEMFVLTDPANVAAVGLYRSTGATTETAADRMFVYRLAPTT